MLLSHTSSDAETSNTQAAACILRCTSVKAGILRSVEAGRHLSSGLDWAAPLLSRSKHMLAMHAGKCVWKRCQNVRWNVKFNMQRGLFRILYKVAVFWGEFCIFLSHYTLNFSVEKKKVIMWLSLKHIHTHSRLQQAFSLLKRDPDILAWNRRLLRHDISRCFSQTHTHIQFTSTEPNDLRL